MRDWTNRRTWSWLFSFGVLSASYAWAAETSPAAAGTLERLLLEGNWQAVEIAKQQGASALPILRRSSTNEDYRVRQIVMTCAGRIGIDEGASLLAAGLRDTNINVRVAAANELATKPWPGATDEILEQIEKSADENICEALVLAAGHLPGSRTMAVLRPLAGGQGTIAVYAQMALARLGDPVARKSLLAGLSSESPRARYDALDRLRYVNDPTLANEVKKFLRDRAPAVRVGVLKAQRFRRVCDQAVDTFAHLRQLRVPFEMSPETIYSDAELRLMEGL